MGSLPAVPAGCRVARAARGLSFQLLALGVPPARGCVDERLQPHHICPAHLSPDALLSRFCFVARMADAALACGVEFWLARAFSASLGV